ncbi:TPA: hypothetical protein JIR18_13965 [Acinetobacter baumannii]|nr:hypothetical protein [Acinetobacter baumannii]
MEIKIHISWKNCLIGILLIFFIVLPIWSYFPLIFSKIIGHTLGDLSLYGENLGSIGDIYGSLNTLVSSIALLAVAFTTYLQVISLKETRKANSKQLNLAKDAHDEQIKESRNAIFANQFYSLLNYKLSKYKSLEFECNDSQYTEQGKCINGLGVFQILTQYFINEIERRPELFNDRDEADLRHHFMTISTIFFKQPITALLSYFYIYKDLLDLIIKSKLDDEDKALYLNVVSNSMFLEEQMLLFWISPLYLDLKNSIENSRLLNQIWYDDSLKKYAIKFHKKRTFRVKTWTKMFEELEQENPA